MTTKQKARVLIALRLGMDIGALNEMLDEIGNLTTEEIGSTFAQIKAERLGKLNTTKDNIQQQIDQLGG